ncbi:MAG: MATE family efflux transporter, partial [Pseudoflavonifractor sp.]
MDAISPQNHRMRTLWVLALPAIIEQILTTLVSFVDTAMVGVLGASATAAVSVISTSIWLVNGILIGVGVGFSVQISHAIGGGDDEKARAIIRQCLLGLLVCGTAALVLFQCLAGYIPKWLGAEADVYPQAVAYLRFYTLSMPLNAACILFSSILRCMGNTRTPLIFNTAANILNVILNFFLIYPTREVALFGKSFTIFGAGQGVAGAAIASAI